MSILSQNLTVGQFVQLGTTKFEVIEAGGNPLLFAVNHIGNIRFDDNSNVWADSEMRAYLNGEFLNAMSANDQAAIQNATHSFYTKNYSTDVGSPISSTDKIRLLEQDKYEGSPELSTSERLGSWGFWLINPASNGSNRVRYAHPDGQGSTHQTGVNSGLQVAVPALNLESNITLAGTGDFIDPFVVSAAPSNNAPTDITLSNSSVNEGAGPDAFVGSFSAVDADAGDAHTFSLVGGEGDTDNNLFFISGNGLGAFESLSYADGATRSIRVRADDGNGGTFEEVFVIDVIEVPVPPNPTGHSQTIKLRKGLKANLPATAAEGEPLFATDTGELFIGTGSAVVPVIGDVNDDSISKAKLNADVAGAGLVQDVDGSLRFNTGSGLQIASGGGGDGDTVSVKVDGSSVVVDVNGIAASTIDGGTF